MHIALKLSFVFILVLMIAIVIIVPTVLHFRAKHNQDVPSSRTIFTG